MMVHPFERAFDAAAGRPRSSCPRCGDSQVPGALGVVLRGDDELSRCLKCGRYRGPDGQLLGGNNREGKFDGRFLALLLERVEFDAEAGEVEIAFRPGGPKAIKGRETEESQ